MADRVTQVVVSPAIELDDTTARVTQVAVQPAIALDDTTARVTQIVVSPALALDDTTARVAQVIVLVAIIPGDSPTPSSDSRGSECCKMPITTVDEVISQKHHRAFLQYGGALPNKQPTYAGQDAQYFIIQGVTIPESGGIDPIWVADPRRVGKYRLVGRSITPSDLPSATLVFKEKHGALPRHLFKQNCAFNFYENIGTCKDLSDFTRGWSDYAAVYAGAIVTDKDLGDRMGWDSDDVNEDSVSVVLSDVFFIGSLSFGEQASAEVSREVVGVVYGSSVECGACGPQDDGTNRIYAITKSSGSGSPGLPAEVIYTVDGGLNWSQTLIDNLGATEDPLAINIVGSRLVVLGDGAYFYSDIDLQTGVPGSWTKVLTGFDASHKPNDLFVLSPREVFFAANDGWLYKSTDITGGVVVINQGVATSNNLYRIHGDGNGTIVAVGAASTVVKSVNRGATWTVTDDNPSDIALDVGAVAILDHFRYWVGTLDSGRLYYTMNGGKTWVEKAHAGSGAGSIRDIIFANDEVGWFSYDNNTPRAYVYSTWDGGYWWTRDAPRVLNWPTFNRANRLAMPLVDDVTLAANNLAVAGLSGGGTDGVLFLGLPNRL